MFKYNIGDKVYIKGLVGPRVIEARSLTQYAHTEAPSISYRTYFYSDDGEKMDRWWFGESQLSDVDCS